MWLFDWLTGESSSEKNNQNIDVEKYFFNKSSAGAKAGDPKQQFIYGTGLLEGKYISKNISEGFNHVVKSAQQGYIEAEYYLGQIFAKGLHGIAKDINTASMTLLGIAKRDPNLLSEHDQIYYNSAIARLGGLYASGNIMPNLGKTIIDLLSSRRTDLECTYYLGNIFFKGASESSIDLDKAAYWYAVMIENDIRESIKWSKDMGKQVYLPIEEFDGTRADLKQTAQNIIELSNSNISYAQYALGVALFRGWRSIGIDQKAGIKIMKISANNGNKAALAYLLNLQHQCERDSNKGNQAAANILQLILN
jgi:TPR repeat protein